MVFEMWLRYLGTPHAIDFSTLGMKEMQAFDILGIAWAYQRDTGTPRALQSAFGGK